MTTPVTTQVYRVFIKATSQAIWEAITTPEWTDRFGYGGFVDYDLKPGGAFKVYPGEPMKVASAARGYDLPDVIIDGEVIESEPPRRLVQTWRMLMDPTTAAEGFTRLTYEIDELPGGITALTVTHDVEGAPVLAQMLRGSLDIGGAGGGWSWVLSDLKSLLETGKGLAA